jgi:hypothetical protein
MTAAPHTSKRRIVLARSLVVLGALIGVVAAFAGYVRYQALDTDTFRDTAQQLIADDEIRTQIGATLVDQLFANVDVQAAIEEQLPQDQKGLSGLAAAGIQQLADRSATRILERPRVQALWVDSLVRTQQQFVRLLNDETTSISSEGGYLVLNLNPLVVQLGDRVAVFGNVADKLPPDAGKVKIMPADNLETAQDLTHILDVLGLWLWVIPLLLFAAAIAIARGRRRLEVRAVAWAVILVGVLILVLREIAGRYTVNNLVQSDTVRPAVSDAWDIVTSLLADGGKTVLGIGLILLLGVWFAGPSRSGTSSRRFSAPFLARPAIAFGGLAFLFLLLVAWGPTAQTRRPLQVLVLFVILALGLEAVRRLTLREFPEASAISPGDALRSPLDRMQAERAREHRLEELDRLSHLHDSGAISDAEFEAEKSRLEPPR